MQLEHYFSHIGRSKCDVWIIQSIIIVKNEDGTGESCVIPVESVAKLP